MKPQPQLLGVTLFVRSSPESHRFGSLELNVTSEGLLVGVTLHTITEGTCSDPVSNGFSNYRHIQLCRGYTCCVLQGAQGARDLHAKATTDRWRKGLHWREGRSQNTKVLR
jgi:hypothetical protein